MLVGQARDEGNWYETPRDSPRPPAGNLARREEILGGTEDGQKEARKRVAGRGGLAGVGLRRASDVTVMQATNFGNRDDDAELR